MVETFFVADSTVDSQSLSWKTNFEDPDFISSISADKRQKALAQKVCC